MCPSANGTVAPSLPIGNYSANSNRIRRKGMAMPDGIIAHRVELRPCTAADVPGFMEGLNDWRVAQWLPTVPFPYTENDARAFIASTAQATPPNAFAVMHRREGQFLGLVGLARTGDTAELGYWLLSRYHGQGLMAEAVALLLRHQVGSLAAIFATVDRGNAASIKLLEKSGLRLMGEHVRTTPNRQGNVVVLRYQKDFR
jgi:RimJ/RimL family protein N-acetyltransferase